MNKELATKIEEKVNARLEKFDTVPPEKAAGEAAAIKSLCDVLNENEKNEAEASEAKKTRKQNLFLKVGEIVVDGLKIAVPITFYAVWMRRGFEFEKEGTITSKTFKDLISNFKPNKI